MILRDYQEEALSKLFDFWATEAGKAPIIAAPTGSGKSLIIGEFCRRVCSESPHVKIMVLAHVRELLTQNEKELKAVWPEADTGIYSAGLGKRQVTAQITFAGIQSVYSHVFDFGKVDIVIVDECHLIPRDADTRYGKFFRDMKMANPGVAIFGLSASPYRLDSGMLHEGEDALFDGIAYSVDIKKLIRDGYLVSVISKGGASKIDLSGVRIQAGDYAPGELAHAADSPELIKSAVNEIVEYGSDRKAWLLFCSGVEHAEHVALAVKERGIDCEVVTGDTPKERRDKVISDFKEGRLRSIANVGVMTTGINIPRCDLIALLTSTRSTGKYIQMVGRSMRTYPDKDDALLLDFGGNVLEHGPIDAVDPVRRRTLLGNPVKKVPLKECPQCHVIVHTRIIECECGYQFPVVAPHGTIAYDGAVLSGQVKAETVPIAGVWYSRHKKPGKPDSVKVTFFTKLDKEYYTYLGLDHGGYFAEKSHAIVRRFGGKSATVNDALKECDHWRKPIAISVKQRGRFFDVVGIAFDDTQKHISAQKELTDEVVS